MERTITKDILKNELHSGVRPAIELLYGSYCGMLFGYIKQFIPDRTEAEGLLVTIFSKLTLQLQEACDSSLSVYCWMQVEARKIILEHAAAMERNGAGPIPASMEAEFRQFPSSYLTLLHKATRQQQWVFREIFINGREREELALQMQQDKEYIERLLRESLVIIRTNLT